MQVAVAAIAALAATGFAVDLFAGWRRRPRPQAAAWTMAMAAYALATWSLVLGLATGWAGGTFGIFYLLGAVANTMLLATGSVYLVFGPRAGKAFVTFTLVLVGLGAVLVLGTPFVGEVAEGTMPSGREMFTAPGPRIIAAVSNIIGTTVVVGLALYSAARYWRSSRHLAVGNALIALGMLIPAFGGTLTAFGEVGGFAVSLLAGAVLLWAGYRIATAARFSAAAAPSAIDVPDEADAV